MDFLGGAADVGLRVGRLREERGWTYRDLEEATERTGHRVSASVLYRIERGAQDDRPQRVSVDDLVALCRAFDLTPDQMLTSAEALDFREGERLLAVLAESAGTFWVSAQAAFVAAAEVGAKFGGDARDHEVGDYVMNKLQHDLPNPDLVHPTVVGILRPRLSEVMTEGLMYSVRAHDRAERMVKAMDDLAERERQLIRLVAQHGEDSELARLGQEVVRASQSVVESSERVITMLMQWETDHPIATHGEEI
jgi:transcriptional regulator with XRE-family HTH domain